MVGLLLKAVTLHATFITCQACLELWYYVPTLTNSMHGGSPDTYQYGRRSYETVYTMDIVDDLGLYDAHAVSLRSREANESER